MAVASGGIRRIIDAQLAQIKLSHLFTVRVTAEDTERHKPEPDVFLEAARQLDVDPRRCLVFEDSPLGFEAAFKAGMGWVDVRVPANEFVIHTKR
jgi:HAD superfamily hydrolase (TIGR01509 family)